MVGITFRSLGMILLGLALQGENPPSPRIVIRLGHSAGQYAVLNIQGGHIIQEANPSPQALPHSAEDIRLAEEWVHAHSVLSKLSTKHHDLYWEDKKVDLGKVNVGDLYQAVPFQGGVMIFASTYPRRSFFQSWPFKGHLIEARDIEPYCAVYFDLGTLKGEDLWLVGKVGGDFWVFPIPK